jgi:hypothetical protein
MRGKLAKSAESSTARVVSLKASLASGLDVSGSWEEDQPALPLGDPRCRVERKDGLSLFEEEVAKVLCVPVTGAELKSENTPGDLDGLFKIGDAVGEPSVEIESKRRSQGTQDAQINGDGPLDDGEEELR